MSGINCINIFQYPYWLVIPSNQPSSFYWVAPSHSSIIYLFIYLFIYFIYLKYI